MGFKANARKHQKKSGEDSKKSANTTKEGVISCGRKSCEGFADKNMGGRSLSVDNAIETWGDSGYTERKGRVRVCKPCYRLWKKENKSDKDTY